MTYKYIITQSLAMLMSLASNAFEVKSGQMVVVSADTARMEPVAKTALKMLITVPINSYGFNTPGSVTTGIASM